MLKRIPLSQMTTISDYYPMNVDICAVITTYRPDVFFYTRVNRIQKQVGFVVIVNDGECEENIVMLNKWFENENKTHLHHNTKNAGIAASLNIGIAFAKEKGYKWILTLDDDSLVKHDFIERLINALRSINLNKRIGIIGMSYVDPNYPTELEQNNDNMKYCEKRGIITSGSLFSVETFEFIGPFREEFFIDSVDYDFCLRARKKGYAIIKMNEIGFEHTLGNGRIYNFMGLRIVIENHEAFRIYYGFRNLTVLAVEYLLIDPLYSFAVLIRHLKILFIILLFEVDKREKLIEAISGIFDGFRKKLGKKVRLNY